MADSKPNAVRIMENAGALLKLHCYETDGALSGTEVADKLGIEPERCFKTLVTVGSDRKNYVFVIPCAEELDLKKAARCAGVKSVEMLPQKQLLTLTGYVHGGCSPIGMKKVLPTFFEETEQLFDSIAVSGGRIGMTAELNPDKLAELTGGSFADLCR